MGASVPGATTPSRRVEGPPLRHVAPDAPERFGRLARRSRMAGMRTLQIDPSRQAGRIMSAVDHEADFEVVGQIETSRRRVDPQIVEDLEARHGQALFGFVRRLGLSDEQAADSVQEVLLRLWAELDKGVVIHDPRGVGLPVHLPTGDGRTPPATSRERARRVDRRAFGPTGTRARRRRSDRGVDRGGSLARAPASRPVPSVPRRPALRPDRRGARDDGKRRAKSRDAGDSDRSAGDSARATPMETPSVIDDERIERALRAGPADEPDYRATTSDLGTSRAGGRSRGSSREPDRRHGRRSQRPSSSGSSCSATTHRPIPGQAVATCWPTFAPPGASGSR